MAMASSAEAGVPPLAAAASTQPASTAGTASAVWANGKNVDATLGKLDLVAHLKAANAHPQLLACKESCIGMLDFATLRRGGAEAAPLLCLDVGCGIGLDVVRMGNAMAAAGRTGRVLGVDWNDEMLAAAAAVVADDEATAALAARGVQLAVQKEDARQLAGVASGSVDAVFVCATLQHIAESDEALAALARVLRPGGRCVLLEPEAATLHIFSRNAALQQRLATVLARFSMVKPHIGSELKWLLPRHRLAVTASRAWAQLSHAEDVRRGDPELKKTRGMAAMCVRTGVLTQAEADELVEMYTRALEQDDIMMNSCMFIWRAELSVEAGGSEPAKIEP